MGETSVKCCQCCSKVPALWGLVLSELYRVIDKIVHNNINKCIKILKNRSLFFNILLYLVILLWTLFHLFKVFTLW